MTTNESKVAACENIINYTFANKLLCLEALHTSGYRLRWEGSLRTVDKNDRLAVLGDNIAQAHICRKWFETLRSKSEWTTVLQTLLSNTSLSAVGFQHGFNSCIVLSPGTPAVSPKTMANTMEAIFGAAFLDGGADALESVLSALGMTHEFLRVDTT